MNAEKHAKHTQAPRKIHVCCMRSTGGSRNPFVKTINAHTKKKKRKKKAQFSLINKDTFGAVYWLQAPPCRKPPHTDAPYLKTRFTVERNPIKTNKKTNKRISMHANPNKPAHKWALCHYYYLWFDLHVLILVIKPHHTAYQAGVSPPSQTARFQSIRKGG